jgi:hypothetical protein
MLCVLTRVGTVRASDESGSQLEVFVGRHCDRLGWTDLMRSF